MRALLVLASVLSTAWGAVAAQLPGAIVDPAWVHASREKVIVLDVRENIESFTEEGHIPGSILIRWTDLDALGGAAPATAETAKGNASVPAFTELMRSAGLEETSAVVISSRGMRGMEVLHATRLYWLLRSFGHENVAVVDGGTAAWASEGLPLTREHRKIVRRGTWSPRTSGEDHVSTASTAQMHDLEKDVLTRLGEVTALAAADSDTSALMKRALENRLLTTESCPARFKQPRDMHGVLATLFPEDLGAVPMDRD